MAPPLRLNPAVLCCCPVSWDKLGCWPCHETSTDRQVATPTQKDREMWISAEESKDVLKAQGKSILTGSSHTLFVWHRDWQLTLNARYLSCRHWAPCYWCSMMWWWGTAQQPVRGFLHEGKTRVFQWCLRLGLTPAMHREKAERGSALWPVAFHSAACLPSSRLGSHGLADLSSPQLAGCCRQKPAAISPASSNNTRISETAKVIS